LKDKTILIIDDDTEFSREMGKGFEQSGCKVAMAADCREAIDFLLRNTADLIISEVRMPNLWGADLMEEIRRKGIDAPVIFLTAHGEVESYMDLMNMGAFDYFNKPMSEREILKAAQEAIEMQHQ
jgi:DNA-binding NtrC family response regulator